VTDATLHYLILFGGMTVASMMHRAADALGWNTYREIRKFMKRRRESLEHQSQSRG
jgi:hypothetical protein